VCVGEMSGSGRYVVCVSGVVASVSPAVHVLWTEWGLVATSY
jgi:hypothetical protein